jgi:hypothetical protein
MCEKFGAFWTTGLPEILKKIQIFVWQGCQNSGFLSQFLAWQTRIQKILVTYFNVFFLK